MATLFNTKISATYEGLFKTIDNAAITASLKELTDGSGNQSGLYVNTAGDFKVSNILEWGSLKDTGTGVTITRYVTSTDGIENFDNNTSLPTSAAVKLYVDSKFATSDTLQEVLSFGNTTGGNDIVVSASDDITFTDSSKILMGAGSDLQIYHDGINSYIADLGTGSLRLLAEDFRVRNAANNASIITGIDGGGVFLYYNGNEKIETTNTGAEVTGNLIVTGTITGAGGSFLPLAGGTMTGATTNIDDVQVRFGTGNDLRIFHTGGNSYMENVTGDWYLKSANAFRVNSTANESMIIANPDGSVDLYYDNSKKFETTSAGVSVTGALSTTTNVTVGANATFVDNGKAIFGASSDFQIFHNATSNANIISSLLDRQLQITSNNLFIGNQAASENMITAIADGAVSLYYDNTKRIETVTAGAKVTGNLEVTGTITGSGGSFLPLAGGTMTGNTIHNDNVKSIYGTSSDGLEVYHDGSNSYIKDTGTGNLRIRSTSLRLEGSNASNMIVANESGNVNLYYNGSQKLATTNTGIAVTGNAALSTGFSIPDSQYGKFGTGDDVIIGHDGTNSIIRSSTGDFYIDQAAVTKSMIFRVSDANSLDTTALTISRNADASFGRDVTIAGDLTVNGTTTTVNSQTLAVVDPLIQLAKDNTANSLDIGLYGDYNDGTARYLGLFSDASDSNKFKLFKGTTVEPTTTVDIGGAGYVAADLQVAGFEATTGAFSSTGSFGGDVTVGTGIIKSAIGGDIAIVQGSKGIRINDAASAITPTTATANNDNAIDLGVSNIRWKDLYLGGSITAGGATFSGSITIDDDDPYGGLFIEGGNAPGITIIDETLSTCKAGIFQQSTTGNEGRLLIQSDINNTGANSTIEMSVDGSNALVLDSSQNATFGGNINLAATKQLFFDGGGNTYITEDSADRLRFFTGGAEFMRFTEDTTNLTDFYTNINAAAQIQLIQSGSLSPELKFNNGTVIAGIDYSDTSNLRFIDRTNARESVVFNLASGLITSRNSSNTVTTQINQAGDSYFNGGNVGIAWSSPSDFTSVNADNLVVGSGTGSNGITVFSSTNAYGQLAFADGTGTNDQWKGLIQYAHPDDSMRLFTANTERLRIDSSGRVGIGVTPSYAGVKLHTKNNGTDAYNIFESSTNKWIFGQAGLTCQVGGLYGTHSGIQITTAGYVGIGTDSADNILHIRKGDTGYASQVGADTMLFLETTNVSNALQFTSANTGQQYIMFGDDDSNAGWISYNHSDNNLNFRVNGSERMRIDSSGTQTWNMSNANVVISGSTGGNATMSNTTGTWAFRADGSSVNSATISSTSITLNEDTDVNGQLVVSHGANYVARFVNTATSMSNDNYTFEVDSSSHVSNMSAAGAMAVDVNTGRAFTITGAGLVGIGLAIPQTTLDIAASTPTLRLTNTQDPLGDGTVGTIEFFTNDSSTGATRAVSSIVCDNQAGSSVPGGDLVFKTSLGGSGSPVATEKLRIKDNGIVELQGKDLIIDDVNEHREEFITSGNVTISFDIDMKNIAASGQIFEVFVGFTHYSTTYGASLHQAFFQRSTVQSDITLIHTYFNQTSTFGGAWSVSYVDATTIRVSKSAGTHASNGYGYLRVTQVKP